MSGAPGRLEALAVLLAAGGLLMTLRSAVRLVRTVRARSTRGAPYREGMIADRALGLLMTLPIPAAGALFGFLSFAMSAFQDATQPVMVGRLEARHSGWGRTAVTFRPDEGYPARSALQGEVAGSRWAVAGDFISWDPAVAWLGLRSGHRMRYLLGTADPSGLSKEDGSGRVELEPLPEEAAALVAWARFIPFLRIEIQASGWIRPAALQVVDVRAGPHGYITDIAAQQAER
jgi:hypothetical protein